MNCNILMVMHGHYAEELLKTAEMFICEHPSVDVLPLLSNDSVDHLERRLRAYLRQHQNVLILTDMMAGTPNIICSRMMKEFTFTLVCGTNLSMLIEVLVQDHVQDSKELGKLICEKGREDIVYMNTILKKENQQKE